MSFAIGLTDELSARLELIGSGGDSNKELKKCIEIHQDLKNYVKTIQDNFAAAILVQGFLSSIIMCTTVFTMSMVRYFSLQTRFMVLKRTFD